MDSSVVLLGICTVFINGTSATSCNLGTVIDFGSRPLESCRVERQLRQELNDAKKQGYVWYCAERAEKQETIGGIPVPCHLDEKTYICGEKK